MSAPEVRDPWPSYGWLLWATWMIFLAFPALESWDEPLVWAQVVGLVGTGMFAVVYAFAMWHGFAAAMDRRVLVALAVLVVITVAEAPIIGLAVMSYLPFLLSLGMFALPRPVNWWWSAAVLVTTIAVPWVLDPSSGWFFLSFVVFAVAIGTGAGRLMSEQGSEYARVQEELTVTTERDRVARDVHDVMGHTLTVVAVKAELAERLVLTDPERARAELVDIQALTRQGLAEVRATVGGLRTARLDDELIGAGTALRAAGIIAALPTTAEVLEPRHRTVAAWVLREAITNVVRHSGANSCRVELLPTGIRVIDDGRGVTDLVPGNGLRGLDERVRRSGGRLEVTAPSEGGASLEVVW